MTSGLENALEKLKMKGVRITPQRHAILDYLTECVSHPTADEIYRALEVRFSSISVATVYNNLRLFTEAGLIRELTYGDHSSRFDGNLSDHYHAVCDICGKMVDFEYPNLKEVEGKASQETGFHIHGHRLEVHGTCSQCL